VTSAGKSQGGLHAHPHFETDLGALFRLGRECRTPTSAE
jgi:hypothetical protein